LKKIILIPTRIESTRLPGKALLLIDNIPLIIHTYKRAILSSLKDDVYVCTHSKEIIDVCKKYNANFVKTGSSHINGTERIAEASRILRLGSSSIIVDVQGDEPLIDPKNIDQTLKFFLKNRFDIVVPHLEIKEKTSKNIVKILVDKNNKVNWFSRSNIPYFFNSVTEKYLKHLSIIVFKNSVLQKYSKIKKTKYENIESIELLRALEGGFSIGSPKLKGDSFSVDVINDYQKAIYYFKKDKIKKNY
jgi:3-deoxy-manno-octulosonate cytidylyltransferase (CMP-KDO synthetase)